MYLWLTWDLFAFHLWPSCVTHLWPYCYRLVTVYIWNAFENCMKFSLKIARRNSFESCVRFFEKLSEILLKIAYYFLKSYMKCSKIFCDIPLKVMWKSFKNYVVWSKMIRNCHHIWEEKLQKNLFQRHFVAQFILDKRWKFQPDSSNGTPQSCKGCSVNPCSISWTI